MHEVVIKILPGSVVTQTTYPPVIIIIK